MRVYSISSKATFLLGCAMLFFALPSSAEVALVHSVREISLRHPAQIVYSTFDSDPIDVWEGCLFGSESNDCGYASQRSDLGGDTLSVTLGASSIGNYQEHGNGASTRYQNAAICSVAIAVPPGPVTYSLRTRMSASWYGPRDVAVVKARVVLQSRTGVRYRQEWDVSDVGWTHHPPSHLDESDLVVGSGQASNSDMYTLSVWLSVMAGIWTDWGNAQLQVELSFDEPIVSVATGTWSRVKELYK